MKLKKLVGGLLVHVLVTTTACGLCGDEVRSRTKSPDATWTATWWVRDCGATTDYYTHVSLSQNPSEFSAERADVLTIKGRPDIVVTWQDRRKLSIRCPGCSATAVSRQVVVLGDVELAFDFAPVLRVARVSQTRPELLDGTSSIRQLRPRPSADDSDVLPRGRR